jgi:hypothetical protein
MRGPCSRALFDFRYRSYDEFAKETYWPDFIARPASTKEGADPAVADAVVPPELADGWKAYAW